MTSPIDEGLAIFRPDFLADSQALFDRLVDGIEWDDRIHARRVASFGVPYNYSGTIWQERPIPPELAPILDAVAAFAGYAPNNCLINYYADGGSTMGYHADSTADLEPDTGISIVSLGARRSISFRRSGFRRNDDRSDVHALVLDSGSLLHMSAPMQTQWRHAILKDSSVAEGRISLTFRRVRPGVAESI